MFLGVVLHCSLTFMQKDYGFSPIMDASRSLGFDVLVLGIHAFRMELFFFVAGYFAAMLVEKRGIREFVKNRLLRLAVPLIVGGLILIPLTNLAFVLVDKLYPRPPGAPLEGWQSTRSGRLFDYSLPVHLWFLIYLLSLSALGVTLREIARRTFLSKLLMPLADVTSRAITAPWGILALACPVLAVNLLMTSWPVDTPDSWLPIPRVLALYGVFFACGWVVFVRGVSVSSIGKSWRLFIALSLVVLLPALIAAGVQFLPALESASSRRGLSPRLALLPAMTVQALLAWSMTFGVIGLFNHLFSTGAILRPSTASRVMYFSDAAYWVYLVHLPLVYLLTLAFHDWHVPALIKFPATLLTVTACCLVSYHVLVRFTVLGTVLNGKRAREDTSSPRAQENPTVPR